MTADTNPRSLRVAMSVRSCLALSSIRQSNEEAASATPYKDERVSQAKGFWAKSKVVPTKSGMGVSGKN